MTKIYLVVQPDKMCYAHLAQMLVCKPIHIDTLISRSTKRLNLKMVEDQLDSERDLVVYGVNLDHEIAINDFYENFRAIIEPFCIIVPKVVSPVSELTESYGAYIRLHKAVPLIFYSCYQAQIYLEAIGTGMVL